MHRNPAVTKANPPTGDSQTEGASSRVRAGEEEVQDEQKVSPNFLKKKKNKNHVPLVKASTKKKAGEKPEEEEEGDMLENKKKDGGNCKKDGCGCNHSKKKKKMDSLTAGDLRQDKKAKKGGDPCWAGYEAAGMKMKGGKKVPNCIPKAGTKSKKKDTYMKKDSAWASGFKFDGKALHMESQNLAATEIDRAKRKKNAQGQPRNKIMAGTRNT